MPKTWLAYKQPAQHHPLPIETHPWDLVARVVKVNGNTCHRNWDKSSGTLLPRPARYFLAKPTNSRGLGSWLSSWKRHLGSSILTMLFLFGELLLSDEFPCWLDPAPFGREERFEFPLDLFGG